MSDPFPNPDDIRRKIEQQNAALVLERIEALRKTIERWNGENYLTVSLDDLGPTPAIRKTVCEFVEQHGWELSRHGSDYRIAEQAKVQEAGYVRPKVKHD